LSGGQGYARVMSRSSEPPVGTIALLFTDIEGSTRLAARVGVAWPGVLGEHHAVLSAAIAAEGGFVDSTEGDAFFATFADPAAAARAAVAALRGLRAHRWPGEVGELRVRMGLHVGYVERAPTGYVGLEVHRAARVAAAAHGGQLLLTAAARELIGDAVPTESVGVHELKDFPDPVQLFCAVVDGRGAASFPAPRTSAVHPDSSHNLPAEVTRFVGRDRELIDVATVLGVERVVTLVGSGGVGKTRLALEVAAGQVGSRIDGVWFVELAPVSGEGSVGRAIAATLGIREPPDRSAVEAVVAVLGSHDALLVLDNCEHVVEEAAVAVDAVARACRGVTTLATSREPLAIAGENVVRVSPLRVPDSEDLGAADLSRYDSVALFLDRARVHDSSFAADEASLECVARICRRLDGIPLALELAAARTRGLGVGELEGRLDERFRVLTAGGRGRLARQQTLAAALDWSFDLLSPREQLLFVRLSVFAGGFDLGATEAVCSGEDIAERDVWELLSSLVDKSLVEVESSASATRYRLLETMREYGRERLLGDRDAGVVLVRGHLEHYLVVAEAADLVFARRAGRETGAALALDHDNFRAALRASLEQGLTELGLRLAASLAAYWRSRGLYREAVNWLGALLEQQPADQPPALRARASFALGSALMSLSRLPETAARLDEALAIARAQADDPLTSRILGSSAFCSYLEGESEAAMALANEAFATANRTGDPELIAVALARQADAYDGSGDQARAVELLEEALELLRAADDELQLAVVLHNSAEGARHFGELDLARERLEECVALCEARDNQHILAPAKRALAGLLLQQGEDDAAVPLAHEALRLTERTGSPLYIAYAVLVQAEVASRFDDLTRAAFLHGVADTLFHEAGASPEPVDTKLRGANQKQLISRMGSPSFQREYERGRASSREAALAFARQPLRNT
jgi:predicted ATPase/class 3 adenylate cyclase